MRRSILVLFVAFSLIPSPSVWGQGSSVFLYQGLANPAPAALRSPAVQSQEAPQAEKTQRAAAGPLRDRVWDQESDRPAYHWLFYPRLAYQMYESQSPTVDRPLYPDTWVYRPLLDMPLAERPWEDRPYKPTISWAKPAEVFPSEAKPTWDRPNVKPPTYTLPTLSKPTADRPHWDRAEEERPIRIRPEYQRPQDVRPDYRYAPE